MSIGRPLTEAEKQLRREKSRAFWDSLAAEPLKEKARLRRIAYNKTKIAERLSPEARKKSGQRLTHINKTRVRTEKEIQGVRERAIKNNASGKFRRGPLSDAEKQLHRQRLIGNMLGAGHSMSLERRAAHSERMKRSNPMKNAKIVAKAQKTIKQRHGIDYSSRLFKRLWREGKIKGKPLSEKAKRLNSQRMKRSNPMKNPDVVKRARLAFTPARREAASQRMKQTWAEGKITPSMFMGLGNVKAANKTERKLFPILRYYHGRFTGNGTYWLSKTASGVRRNPDFVFGDKKMALLVHGTFWHRDPVQAALEMNDYMAAGWHLYVLWTKRISNWMLEPIKEDIKLWLAEVRSSQSQTPVLRQYMTWNADRIITS